MATTRPLLVCQQVGTVAVWPHSRCAWAERRSRPWEVSTPPLLSPKCSGKDSGRFRSQCFLFRPASSAMPSNSSLSILFKLSTPETKWAAFRNAVTCAYSQKACFQYSREGPGHLHSFLCSLNHTQKLGLLRVWDTPLLMLMIPAARSDSSYFIHLFTHQCICLINYPFIQFSHVNNHSLICLLIHLKTSINILSSGR